MKAEKSCLSSIQFVSFEFRKQTELEFLVGGRETEPGGVEVNCSQTVSMRNVFVLSWSAARISCVKPLQQQGVTIKISRTTEIRKEKKIPLKMRCLL